MVRLPAAALAVILHFTLGENNLCRSARHSETIRSRALISELICGHPSFFGNRTSRLSWGIWERGEGRSTRRRGAGH